MYLTLAWRNIWRNPRRTLVIVFAIIIGVWSMIFLGALMRGMEVGMIKNGISTLTGVIQVHSKGYRSDPTIENSMEDPEKIKESIIDALPSDADIAFRVRVNAVISNARHSSGVTLVGIDPETEAKVSFIGDAISRGRYLKQEDTSGIIIGEALLKKFKTKPGRRLVVMAQGADKEIASRAFRILGTFRAEMEAIEKEFVFVLISSAQKMLKLGSSVSEASILIPDYQESEKIAGSLKSVLLSSEFEVHNWEELLPILKAYIELSDGFIYIWYLVVFIAMSFGIVNTTLMAVFERMREFGLLKSLGMKPGWIMREVLLESVFLLALGLIIGNILAFLSILALSGSGIDLSSFAAGAEYVGMTRIIYPIIWEIDVIMANLVVFVLGLLVSAYPAFKAARFTPVEALAHI